MCPSGGNPPHILPKADTTHHFETMRNHRLLVFTGESSFQACLGGARFRPSTVWLAVLRFLVAIGWLPEQPTCATRGSSKYPGLLLEDAAACLHDEPHPPESNPWKNRYT